MLTFVVPDFSRPRFDGYRGQFSRRPIFGEGKLAGSRVNSPQPHSHCNYTDVTGQPGTIRAESTASFTAERECIRMRLVGGQNLPLAAQLGKPSRILK